MITICVRLQVPIARSMIGGGSPGWPAGGASGGLPAVGAVTMAAMASLLERTRAEAGTGLPHPAAAGLTAAATAAAASLGLILIPVVVGWLAGHATDWPDALRASVAIWLLAHHVSISVAGVGLGLTPLGLTGLSGVAAAIAARRMAGQLDPDADRLSAGLGRRHEPGPAWRAVLVMAAGHGVIGGALALLITDGRLRPVLWQAAAGPALLALLAGAIGAAAHAGGGWRSGLRLLRDRVPEPVAGWLGPAVVAVAIVLAAAIVVLLVALGLGAARIVAVHRALGGGPVDVALLVLAQLSFVPDLVVWVGATLAGPGFAVGAGSSITVSSSVLGPLPAVPVLAALPAPGGLPLAALALLAVPPAAGVVAGRLLVRDRPDQPWAWLLTDVAGAALAAGALFGALGGLAGGAAGPGRLTVVGPVPDWPAAVLLVGAVAAEVLLGALAGAVVGRLAWAGYRRRP
jgi:Family of unknown function (DUF6350)